MNVLKLLQAFLRKSSRLKSKPSIQLKFRTLGSVHDRKYEVFCPVGNKVVGIAGFGF